MVIFDGVKSGEMLDFSGFCRSGYRSGFGDFGVILNISDGLMIWKQLLMNYKFVRSVIGILI